MIAAVMQNVARSTELSSLPQPPNGAESALGAEPLPADICQSSLGPQQPLQSSTASQGRYAWNCPTLIPAAAGESVKAAADEMDCKALDEVTLCRRRGLRQTRTAAEEDGLRQTRADAPSGAAPAVLKAQLAQAISFVSRAREHCHEAACQVNTPAAGVKATVHLDLMQEIMEEMGLARVFVAALNEQSPQRELPEGGQTQQMKKHLQALEAHGKWSQRHLQCESIVAEALSAALEVSEHQESAAAQMDSVRRRQVCEERAEAEEARREAAEMDNLVGHLRTELAEQMLGEGCESEAMAPAEHSELKAQILEQEQNIILTADLSDQLRIELKVQAREICHKLKHMRAEVQAVDREACDSQQARVRARQLVREVVGHASLCAELQAARGESERLEAMSSRLSEQVEVLKVEADKQEWREFEEADLAEKARLESMRTALKYVCNQATNRFIQQAGTERANLSPVKSSEGGDDPPGVTAHHILWLAAAPKRMQDQGVSKAIQGSSSAKLLSELGSVSTATGSSKESPEASRAQSSPQTTVDCGASPAQSLGPCTRQPRSATVKEVDPRFKEFVRLDNADRKSVV